MSGKRSWYVLDTAGSKPYRAIGPCQNYHHADQLGKINFDAFSLVSITRRMACSKYRTKSVDTFQNASDRSQ